MAREGDGEVREAMGDVREVLRGPRELLLAMRARLWAVREGFMQLRLEARPHQESICHAVQHRKDQRGDAKRVWVEGGDGIFRSGSCQREDTVFNRDICRFH